MGNRSFRNAVSKLYGLRLHRHILIILFSELVITDTLHIKDVIGCIAFDVGGEEFDCPHAGDVSLKTGPDDPVPYAAFGLLWRAFSPIVFSKEFVKSFDESFVQAIDLADIGETPNPISVIIEAMNHCESSVDCVFSLAVKFAQDALIACFDAYFKGVEAQHQ